MLVTVTAQFTAKMTYSEKAIYFLSLKTCSINKLKSHMFFPFKNFIFSNFTWKNIFAAGNGGGRLAPLAPRLSLRPCVRVNCHFFLFGLFLIRFLVFFSSLFQLLGNLWLAVAVKPCVELSLGLHCLKMISFIETKS